MKSLQAIALGLLTALVVVLPAQSAGSGIDQAVATLKEGATVYVDPNAEGTNSETAGVLTDQLKDGDRIILVMLSASQLNGSDGGVASLMAKINKATGGKMIIGLSVGDQVAAYSSILPAGTAVDLMKRASSVSANVTETLQTYVRNVHDWQIQHPNEPASKPTKSQGSKLWLWLFAVLIIVLVAVGFIAMYGSFTGSSTEVASVRYKNTPSTVRDYLEEILKRRSQINNPDLRARLLQICIDTEAYFTRAGRSGISLSQRQSMERNVKTLLTVVDRYIDIQNNTRYYDDPDQLMATGVRAISGFEEAVMNSIKRGNRQELTDFNVDTDILDAQRYA